MEDPSLPYAAEMLQLDYFYCCDEVGGELLVQASQALSQKVVDTEVLELLEALDELACTSQVVPRAGGALRLEIRTQCVLAPLRASPPDVAAFARAVNELFGEDRHAAENLPKPFVAALRKRATELEAVLAGVAGRKQMLLTAHSLDKALDALAEYLQQVHEALGPSFIQRQQLLAAQEGIGTAPTPARKGKDGAAAKSKVADSGAGGGWGDDDRMPCTQAPFPESEPAAEEEDGAPAPAPAKRGGSRAAKPPPPAPPPAPAPAPAPAAAKAEEPRAVVHRERTTLRALREAYPHADFEALRDGPTEVAPRARAPPPPQQQPQAPKPPPAVVTLSDSEAEEALVTTRGGGRARRGRGAAKSVAQPRKIYRPMLTAEEEEEEEGERLQTQAGPQTQAAPAVDAAEEEEAAVAFDPDETQAGPAASPPRAPPPAPPTSPPMSAGRTLLVGIRRMVGVMTGGLLGASAVLKSTGVDPLAEALQQAALAGAGAAAPEIENKRPAPSAGKKAAENDKDNDALLPGGRLRINMFERGATARTVAWGSPGSSAERKRKSQAADSDEVSDPIDDDDDEDEDADAPARKRRLHLPTADPAAAAAVRAPLAPLAAARGGGGARRVTSPAAAGGGSGRRASVRWSKEEEELLIRLVAQMGSAWAAVLAAGRSEAQGFHAVRTQVDLKDKWRNLSKYGRV